MGLIVPAVLPSSLDDMRGKIARFAHVPAVSRIQIDVVDGRFASPPTWPYTTESELKDMVTKGEMLPHLDRITYEVDLMCLDAERAAGPWLSLGASRLTFHAESFMSLPSSIASIKQRYGDASISIGLAIQVDTDLSLIEPVLSEVDYVQCMGIASIGKQGQPLDPRVLGKIRTLKKQHPELILQVDGGVTLGIARELIALDVSDLVVGSGLLRAGDPALAFAKFTELQAAYRPVLNF